MGKAKRQALQQRRQASVENLTARYKRRMGERLAASRKLFKKRVVAVDPHTHSIYSDGQSTVAENAERAKLVGVDLIFASDHGTIRQKRSAAPLSNATWGEESDSAGFHLGLLRPTKPHRSRPAETLTDGLARARKLTDFVWLAHPVGFSGLTPKYRGLILKAVAPLDEVAMEVLNGFAVIDRAHYRTGLWGVWMMDRLLCAGKKVTPLGSSDCHWMVEIGNAWTGVLGATRSPASVIKTLRAGRCFASEAPLLDLSINGKPMGSTLKPKKGAALTLRFRAADSAGLAWVRVISGGKILKEIYAKGQPVVSGTLSRKATGKPAHYRVECAGTDDRRAFSAPVYVR